MAPMAEADRCSSGRRQRFAVACSVLSRCVRAEAAAGYMAVAQAQAASTMLLMPGADVVSSEETAAAAPAPAQLTIMYGGRVLVFDDVPADRAAVVMRVAAARQDAPGGSAADLQVARKASLQRLMEKRRDRHAARAPYAPARPAAVAPKIGQEERNAGSWLGLGIHGGCAC